MKLPLCAPHATALMAAKTHDPTSTVIHDQTTIDGLVLRGTTRNLTSGVSYLATAGQPLTSLHLHHVTAPNVRQAGIVLSAERKGGTLTGFIISENLARVVNTMTAGNGILRHNLPEMQERVEPTASPDKQ